ncbi:MAG: DNA replication/repair protein RecF [Acidobacteriota bacterium]|nr:DNA replication/repair protein RecF [Acidobacteriota bacterium]
MYLEQLLLTDFRSYGQAEFSPAPHGITVVTGANGAGKTNLIEAVAYLSTLKSLRASPPAALIRAGAPSGAAVLRSRVRHDARLITVDAELHATGRDRVQVNGQVLRRTRDLLGALQVTVFSPDDLSLVKGPPAGRRSYLDDLLVALQPRRYDLLSELERVLKQRNALLKSALAGRPGGGGGWRPGRPLPDDVRITLDVWDAKLVTVGEALVAARRDLVDELQPLVEGAYGSLASGSAAPPRLSTTLAYEVSWSGSLAAALDAARPDDLRRGVTTVGPQRDDLGLAIGSLPARTHASQGEQRTLALALRLAGHRLLATALDTPPVLLLDDVFSELDAARADSLMANLPALSETQAIVTTAGELPSGAAPAAWFRVEDGKLLA